MGTHPTKRAKTSLVASRASQRAAILAKKRAATNTSPQTHIEEEGGTPEILRGIDGSDGEGNLDVSLGPCSPPPPPLLPPLTPSADYLQGNNAGDPEDSSDSSESGIVHRTAITEADFHQEVWEEGRCFNTQDPSWQTVFPYVGKDFCRFCHRRAMPDPVVENSREYECEACFKMTTLQLVLKHALRRHYPVALK